MKKALSLILSAVCILSISLMFTSCKGEKDAETTVPSTTENKTIGYTAEVTEDYLKVFKDGQEVQKLTYPEEKKKDFLLAFAENHISFKDLNFDGKIDICLAINSLGDGFSYICWLATDDEFVYNSEISALKSITIDSAKKHVISTEKENDKTIYVVYQWNNGKLEKVSVEDALSDTAENNVLGSVSSNQTTSVNKNDSNKNNTTQNNGSSSNKPNTTQSSNNTGTQGNSDGISYGKDDGSKWY